ncbi:hypothetical protein JCM18899A_13820 [Nocardioides sp. AN3]
MTEESPKRRTLADLPAPDAKTVRKLLALLTPPVRPTESTDEPKR